MRYLATFLFFAASFSAHAIDITAPTAYDNGDALLIEDIQHYVICISTVPADICESEIIVVGDVLDTSILPENTHHIKAKTVDVYGVTGDYGTMFTHAFRGPLPPTITLTITIEIE